MNEQDCHFVSSRGLARSCDVFPSQLISDSPELNPEDYKNIHPGSVVYVTATQLRGFIRQILPNLDAGIVLVTGDADITIPGKYIRKWTLQRKLLSDDRILHWFGQNLSLSHPRVTQIPIGLDYHTLQGEGWKGAEHGQGEYQTAREQEAGLLAIRGSLDALDKRPLTAYANFSFSLNRDRIKAAKALKAQSFMLFEPQRMSRELTWKRQGAASFVISPLGNGVDCHRTWEALVLGCIPVIKRNYLSDLFNDLPVLFVDSWKDISKTRLLRYKQSLTGKTFNWDKLTLAYWKATFRQAAGT